MHTRALTQALVATALVLLSPACGGGGGGTSGPAPVTVTVNPPSASVGTGQSLTLTATVANASNGSVTWSLGAGSIGALTSDGVYTAPIAINGATVAVQAIATSVADPSKNSTATLTVTARAYAGTLTDAASPTVPRAYGHTLTLLPNGKVLLAGGVSTGPGAAALNQAEVYDPATNTWTVVGTMVAVRHLHAATLLPNGKVLLVGGVPMINVGNSALKSAELFDPATNTFTATGSTTFAHEDVPAVTLTNGKAVLIGGYNIPTPEVYDPASGTWTSGTGTTAAYYAYSATVALPNGKALAVGGQGNGTNGPSTLAYVYDAGTNALTAGTAMTDSRRGHQAFYLPNGKVLVAGGAYLMAGNPSYIRRASAELYDPATGGWTTTGAMIKARSWGFGSLLSDGRVLMAMGSDNLTPAAEIYNPATGTWTAAATGSASSGPMYSQAVLLRDGRVLIVGGINTAAPAQLFQ